MTRRVFAYDFKVAIHVGELVHLLRFRSRGFKAKPETCNANAVFG